MGKADAKSAHRNNRTICLPFSQEVYNANINNAVRISENASMNELSYFRNCFHLKSLEDIG